MSSVLRISSELRHDGDGVVSYNVLAQNASFKGTVDVWGNVDEHIRFANALEGFPRSARQLPLDFAFGGGTDSCDLRFQLADSLGAILLIARFGTRDSPLPQTAQVVLRVEPAALDVFVGELRAFDPGSANKAELRGNVA